MMSKPALSCDMNYINNMNTLIEVVKEDTQGVASDKLPNSITIAQAVLETGNGKSYAAKVKKNHFGLSEKKEVMSFDSSLDSVSMYFETLNSKPYYEKLRKKLKKGDNNINKIVNALARVYARDKEYPQKVIRIIDQCQLARFDENWKLATF